MVQPRLVNEIKKDVQHELMGGMEDRLNAYAAGHYGEITENKDLYDNYVEMIRQYGRVCLFFGYEPCKYDIPIFTGEK